MNRSINEQAESRRKKPSAFFAFMRAVMRGFTVLLLAFFGELVIAGLLPVWKEAVCYGILWLVPALLGAGCFLDGLIHRPKAQFGLWMVLLIGVCAVQAWLYFTPSSQIGQIRMLKNQGQAMEEQQTIPLIKNVIKSDQSDIPFYIEMVNGQPLLTPEKQAMIASYLDLLPPSLQKKAGGIYFLSEETFYSIEGCLQDPDITGITQLEKAAIFLKDRSSFAPSYRGILKDGTPAALDNPLAYRDTLVHEFMHLADIQTEGDYLQLSASPEWMSLFEKYRMQLGDYAATSPEEFFAEAGVYYLLYPELLKNQALDVYQWLEQNVLKPE